MKQMVISCFPDGSIQHTLKDQFLHLLPGQRREVERMSDIEHDTNHDMFHIRLKARPEYPVTLRNLMDNKITSYRELSHIVDEDSDIVLFTRYEDAVTVEIDLINVMRLRGIKI